MNTESSVRLFLTAQPAHFSSLKSAVKRVTKLFFVIVAGFHLDS
jgi:hypothetical protein